MTDRRPLRPAAAALTALTVLVLSLTPATTTLAASSTPATAASGDATHAQPRPATTRPAPHSRTATLTSSRSVSTQAAGDPSHYALFPQTYDYRSGRNVTSRWDPCRIISYKVNAGSQGATGLSEVRTAVARLSARTGIRLAYAGATTYTPRGTASTSYVANGRTYYRWDAADQRTRTGVPLVVALTTRGGSNLFTGGEVGLGGFQTSSSSTSGARITDGFVLAQTNRGLRPGFQAGASSGGLLLHELAHAFGLDHYGDPTVMMNPSLTERTPADYAPGDITGLTKVGRNQGCINPSWVTKVRTSRRPAAAPYGVPAVHVRVQSR